MTHELENLLRNESDRRRLENFQNTLNGGVTPGFYQLCAETANAPEERRKRLYVIKGGKQ